MHIRDQLDIQPDDGQHTALTATEDLVRALARAPDFDRGDPVYVIETHISHVLLAGEFAYKIKKPIDLGFADFRSLASRRFFCQEELRLNRRLAPGYYVDVLPITGSIENPRIGGAGRVLDYVVKMRRFDENQQLDRLFDTGTVQPGPMIRLARDICMFHQNAAIAATTSTHGNIDQQRQRAMENFDQLGSCSASPGLSSRLQGLRTWTRTMLSNHRGDFNRRRRNRHIRECHGDMHLGNMFLHHQQVYIFDCLEFNADLRWIDVISDLAFVLMDLHYHRRRDLSRRVLNAYLECSGDYDGLSVLRYYFVYRALVRAKIAWIRRRQQIDRGEHVDQRYAGISRHVALAICYTREFSSTPIIITHGVSGTGKSHVSELLAVQTGAIRLRSDVERKRAADDDADSATVIYSARSRQVVYDRLLTLTEKIVGFGYPVIIDATFLTRAQRLPFESLARRLQVPFKILSLTADTEVLRRRIESRLKQGCDPSQATLAVMKGQFEQGDALVADEDAACVHLATDQAYDIKDLGARLFETAVTKTVEP